MSTSFLAFLSDAYDKVIEKPIPIILTDLYAVFLELGDKLAAAKAVFDRVFKKSLIKPTV
ncbi:MAG: hypothetical protein IPI76_16470 [Chloracidobacterium sp.]|nr:hypothetical protein [Chloracidobacterium sp.]